MPRNRSKCLAAVVLYAAGIVVAAAQADVAADADVLSARCGASARLVHNGSPASASRAADAIDDSRYGEDGARLSRAYRDVLEAEHALRRDPAALAAFGPLLRDARARLEAGIAAAAQIRIAIEAPRGFDTSKTADEPRLASGGCSARLPTHAPTHSPAPPSNTGLLLRRHVHARPIWV